MDLEVRDLRLVAALCTQRTTARAAKVLHLSQPSVSRALLSLEDRLDTRLFDRGKRGLVPTPAAQRLASRGEELLAALGELEQSVRDPVEPRHVRLVCECYTAYHWLPSALRRLQPAVPGLSLSLCIEHTEDAVGALQRGDIDAALLTSPRRSDRDIVVRPLMTDEMLFVVAQDHALAKQAALRPADLREHPLFIPRSTRTETRWFMRRVFGRERPRLDVSVIPLTEAMVDLARAGLGIAVVTEWAAGPYLERGDCVAMRLSRGPLLRPWRFAWRRELGDAGPRLLSVLPRAP